MSDLISLQEAAAPRGDKNPIACVRALLEDLEAGTVRAEEIVIVTVAYDSPHGVETSVRSATRSPDPYSITATLGLLALGQMHLTAATGVLEMGD